MEDRLIKFASLIEEGSFTGAAKTLHISQPALTASIKKLERELRATLLVRTRQRLELTPAGEVAYEAAEKLVAGRSHLKQSLSELSNKKNTSCNRLDRQSRRFAFRSR